MATNSIFQKIVKRIFKGNNGKQVELERKQTEITKFLRDNVPNTNQQTWIDAANAEYDLYNDQIKTELSEQKLEDIE